MDNKLDSISAIQVFVRVANSRSFTAAAASLGIPKSTASAMLQRLEQRLGAVLLHRTTRSMRLTLAGERFLEHCLPALEALEAAEQSVRTPRQEGRGRLVVSAPVTLAREFLAPRLGQFLHAHPEVELALRVENHPVDLLAEQVDLALRVGTPATGELRSLKLGALQGGLSAAAEYAHAHGLPSHPQALAQHPLIATQPYKRIAHWLLDDGQTRHELNFRPRLAANEIGVTYAAILAGSGIGWLPNALRQPALDAGSLVPVLPGWQLLPAMEVCLVYLERRANSAALAAFIAFVETAFQDSNKPHSASLVLPPKR